MNANRQFLSILGTSLIAISFMSRTAHATSNLSVAVNIGEPSGTCAKGPTQTVLMTGGMVRGTIISSRQYLFVTGWGEETWTDAGGVSTYSLTVTYPNGKQISESWNSSFGQACNELPVVVRADELGLTGSKGTFAIIVKGTQKGLSTTTVAKTAVFNVQYDFTRR